MSDAADKELAPWISLGMTWDSYAAMMREANLWKDGVVRHVLEGGLLL